MQQRRFGRWHWLLGSLMMHCLGDTGAHAALSIQVSDDSGHTVRLPRPAQRVISLSPHLTEDLFAIGAGAQMVGTVSASDYPAAARAIPVVGGYNGLDMEKIRALQPDLVVAWHTGGMNTQVEQLRRMGIPVFDENAQQVNQVPAVLERLGQLTGHTRQAQQAATTYRQSVQALQQRYHQRKPVRVFYQVWDQPLMTVGGRQMISDAIGLCGGANVFANLPQVTATIDREAVLVARPELIVSSSPAAVLAGWRSLAAIPAVQTGQLMSLSPDLLSRMGPRLPRGIDELCRTIERTRRLHP